jgi:hypothetical protein
MHLYETDFVIIKADGQPLEGLDIIYHYSQIIDDINGNGGIRLGYGEQFISMTCLPKELQERYLTHLKLESEKAK